MADKVGVCVTAVEYGSDGTWQLVVATADGSALHIVVPADVAAVFQAMLGTDPAPAPVTDNPAPPVVE